MRSLLRYFCLDSRLPNCEYIGQLQNYVVRATETLKTSHRPDGKVADELASIHVWTTAADALVNYRMYVPQIPSIFPIAPHAPMGKLLTCLPRLSLAQLRPTLWSTTDLCTCRRDLANFPSPRWETHVCSACCLQGGGVYVGGGTLIISSCTISGNKAEKVSAVSFKSSHRPHGKLTFCSLFAGRRCLRRGWHSGHLIVHHHWQHRLSA
jgi:hypothetical protein